MPQLRMHVQAGGRGVQVGGMQGCRGRYGMRGRASPYLRGAGVHVQQARKLGAARRPDNYDPEAALPDDLQDDSGGGASELLNPKP